VPFRSPLTHAASLLNQHRNFSKIQSHSKFSLDYMNWLGHFEFGLNQKPFYLGDDQIFKQIAHADKNDIDYWLLSWMNYYGYMLNNPQDNVLFFSYDDFCEVPQSALSRLFAKLNIEAPVAEYKPFERTERTESGVNADLLGACNSIYFQLAAKAN
jgi:hypothetical protein